MSESGVCFEDSEGRLYRVMDKLGQPVQHQLLPAVHLRIEALRAAAMMVAGALSSGKTLEVDGAKDEPANTTALALAEQFAAWLETGERG